MDPINDYVNQMSSQAISAMGNYTKIWTDLMANMAMAGLNGAPGMPPPEAARQMRGSIFRTVSDAMDESMRTPQFLEWMRQSMDTMLTFRKQFDSMLTQTRQVLQGTTREDIDTLMITIRHMERRLLDRMEELVERLDEFEDRMEEAGGNGHEEKAPRRPRRASSRRQSASRE